MLIKVVYRSVCKSSSKSFYHRSFRSIFFGLEVGFSYGSPFILLWSIYHPREKCISEKILNSIFVKQAVLLKLHIPQFFGYGLVSKDTE